MDPQQDVVTRRVAIASFVVSALSLIVTGSLSFLSYSQSRSALSESQRQFEISEAAQRESLVISMNPHADGKVNFTNFNFGEKGGVAQIPWEVTIDNTSRQTLSIVKYELSSGVQPEELIYSGIDGGFYGKDGVRLSLPITLSAGESRIFTAYVGFIVPKIAYDNLAPFRNQGLTATQATLVLGRKGLDIYGNAIEFKDYGADGYEMSVAPDRQRSPKIWLIMTSGRGASFLSSASTYAQGG